MCIRDSIWLHIDGSIGGIFAITSIPIEGLNNNLLAYELSPSVTLLEESLCKWFARKIGFDDSSGGIAASGGTLSNLNALIAARHNSGLGSDPNSVLLVSEDAHSSFVKCIRVMGLDPRNLVRIKTDKQGRMLSLIHI